MKKYRRMEDLKENRKKVFFPSVFTSVEYFTELAVILTYFVFLLLVGLEGAANIKSFRVSFLAILKKVSYGFFSFSDRLCLCRSLAVLVAVIKRDIFVRSEKLLASY